MTTVKEYAREGRRDRRKTRLGALAATYMDIEHLRVAQQVRQTHLRLDGAPYADDPVFQAVFTNLEAAQAAIDTELKAEIGEHPCWTDFNVHVKGVGLHLLGLVMGFIRDVTPLTNVSKCWWLCGLGVVDGHAVRLEKGQVANYDMRLKSILLGRLGSQLLKNGDPFARMLYDQFKAQEQAKGLRIETHCSSCKGAGGNDEGGACRKCKGSGVVVVDPSHRRALRRVVKLWVACLWDIWRRAEGLSTVGPYAQIHLGHGGIIKAEDWVAYNLAHKNGQ